MSQDALPRLLPEALLGSIACPTCRGRLLAADAHLTCAVCGDRFDVVDGVPILLSPPAEPVLSPRPDQVALPEELVARLSSVDGWWLHIGAGATAARADNCIEIDAGRFANTSVVADAHRLPFVSERFAAVVAFNVLEHLPDPPRLLFEIRRVLEPGGAVHVQTAFLAAEDSQNPTFLRPSELGLRAWFAEFDVVDLQASVQSINLTARRPTDGH